MYRDSSPYFKIMIGAGNTLRVCHADAPKVDDWKQIGHYGSADDCWQYVAACEDTDGFILLFPSSE